MPNTRLHRRLVIQVSGDRTDGYNDAFCPLLARHGFVEVDLGPSRCRSFKSIRAPRSYTAI